MGRQLRVDWDSLERLLDDGLETTLERHFRELALDQQDVPLDVDWPGYQRDEKAGTFRAISIRDPNEELLGYSGFFLVKHRHYRRSLHALNDVIYVDQPLRNRGLGSLLVDESERLLRWLVPGGLVRVIYHVKVEHPELGALLAARGYEHVENGHWKLVRG